MTYPDAAMESACEAIEEWELTPEQIANLCADLARELKAREENRNEAAWEAWNDPESVAARQHRERTAHLDGFGRSLK